MITIDITRQDDIITACTVKGHAGYDAHGFDIVCAAISTLFCTAGLALMRIAHQEGHFENSPAYGHLAPADPTDHDVQVILETMVLGFREIAKQYESYVTMNE